MYVTVKSFDGRVWETSVEILGFPVSSVSSLCNLKAQFPYPPKYKQTASVLLATPRVVTVITCGVTQTGLTDTPTSHLQTSPVHYYPPSCSSLIVMS